MMNMNVIQKRKIEREVMIENKDRKRDYYLKNIINKQGCFGYCILKTI